MNNKLQYWIELNPVKLFNKINRTNVTPEQIQVHCGNICYWTLVKLKKNITHSLDSIYKRLFILHYTML